jgi:protein-L-isoaspartate(D-aspartate) O-methyltransferase
LQATEVRRPETLHGEATPAQAGLASAKVRERMVDRVRELGVRDGRVLDAMRVVPRHLFVDEALASRAYEDTALPIGQGQTISQPYIVARTIELALEGIDASKARVLEVGTGCGYAAAVLAHVVGDVVSIERVRALHERARDNLRLMRLSNLRLVFGDGSGGVPQAAPYDAIVAAAAGDAIPSAWVEQLKIGGRIVAPVGVGEQQLVVAQKDNAGKMVQRGREAVRFVPLRGGVA